MWELSFLMGRGRRIDALTLSRAARAGSNRWRSLVLGLGLLVCAGGGFLALKALPYSTSWIERVSEDQVLLAPGEKFRAGDLVWDMNSYRLAPTLQPFRDTFGTPCAGKRGLEAARCVSDVIKAKSPRGDPTVEFVDAQFDPAASLRAHMEGAPGHCTTRSAMTATGLLALGVPARIVQVLPRESKGHNLIEVWDLERGWLLFDPHFDSSYLLGDSFLSAVRLSQIQGGLRWRRLMEGQPDPNMFAGATINYPEPWLYTRVGERVAHWPFRGSFAQIGPTQFRFGPAQRLAFGSGVFFGMAALLWGFWVLLRSRRLTGSEAIPSAAPNPI